MQAFPVSAREYASPPPSTKPPDATPFAGSGVDLTTRVEQESATPATRKAWYAEAARVNRASLGGLSVAIGAMTLAWWATDPLVVSGGHDLLRLRVVRIALLALALGLHGIVRWAPGERLAVAAQLGLAGVTGVWALAAALLPTSVGFLVPLVVSFLFPALLRLEGRARLVGLGAQFLVAAVALVALGGSDAALSASYLLAAAAFSWVLGEQITQLQRSAFLQERVAHTQAAALAFVNSAFDGVEQSLEGEVLAREQRIHRLAVEVESSKEQERRRMAQDLHDNLGQLAVAARLDLSRLRPFKAQDPRLASRLERVEAVVEQLLQAAREVIENLRPRVLEEKGLAVALSWLTQRHHIATGCPCTLSLDPPDVVVAYDQSVTVFRIVQEALTNVAKHAEATSVHVELRVVDDVEVEIIDDGRGFDESSIDQPGFGLSGIRQRAEDVGGECLIESRPGRGTRVHVRLPLDIGATLTDSDDW